MKVRLLLVVFLSVVLMIFGSGSILAQSDGQKLDDLNKKISEYQEQIKSLQSQANTLSNQIKQFDAQIYLTQLEINRTEEKIALLGGRIDQLEVSLGNLSSAFSTRAVETYKISRTGDELMSLVFADNLGEVVQRFFYLRKIMAADRELLVRMQSAQDNYKSEVVEQKDLQGELSEQNKVLGAQKVAKANLLAVTKNDEKKYQQLLAKARAEVEAISSIIAGKGSESEVGGVSEGQRIASIIAGSSTCSSGGHLHFEVANNKVHQNPANYLSGKQVVWDNAPDGAFGFGGSWPWPVNDPVRITQGYGMTHYAANLRYYGGAPHTGIDMVSDNNDLTVKAVRAGTLFRGSIGCGGGYLRYVHVKQNDGLDTYYLHVNY